jgi:hypothetical protein
VDASWRGRANQPLAVSFIADRRGWAGCRNLRSARLVRPFCRDAPYAAPGRGGKRPDHSVGGGHRTTRSKMNFALAEAF